MTYARLSALPRLLAGFLVASLWLIGFTGHAQTPIGQWQLIAPGTSATRLVEANGALYVAGDYGLFRYDLADNSVRALSKQDGLAGTNVAALAVDSATGLIVIGYRDTNIDLLDPRTGRIANVADIQRRQIVGDKSINAITTYNGNAFIACSFGVVVLDLRRIEVADSYIGLANGTNTSILSIAVNADSIVVSKVDGTGILIGRRSANLLDFHNWTPLGGTDNTRSITFFQHHFYFVTGFGGMFRIGPAGWRQLAGVGGSNFSNTSLTVSRGRLVIAQPDRPFFTVMRPDESVTDLSPAGIGSVYQALAGAGGQYYLADRTKGLLITDGTTAPQVIAPNGPQYDVSFFTVPVGRDMYAFTGAYSNGFSSGTGGTGYRLGFAHRQDGLWRSYNSQTVDAAHFPVGKDLDLSVAAWNPVNQKLYIGSYGEGMIEWNGPEGGFQQFDGNNSPLLGPLAGVRGPARVTGLAVDAAGKVWVANFHQQASQGGLFSFDPTAPAGTAWKMHLAGVDGAQMAQRVVIDDNGNKWVSCFPSQASSASYLIVYNEASSTYRQLSADANNGALLGPVYCLAKDRKGDIWVGTAKGVQVFYNAGSALAVPRTAYAARQPVIDRRPLLDNQLVKVIAVDGANRKWIGTDDGLYLFGEDGDEAIAHFTAENSPLPSNSVNSISINGTTGEVFVGTDNGLVSYRGSATEPPAADEKPSCTTVFPNPVPARFTGQIAIDGLTSGATVKITDVSGQLVYEAKANGGRAVWNARDYNGRRVRTGIYLAYSADADGQNTCVSKIAVMGE